MLDYVVSLVCGAALGSGLTALLDSAAGVYLGILVGVFAYYVVPEGTTGGRSGGGSPGSSS